jgi:DNA ligase (NAD+)
VIARYFRSLDALRKADRDDLQRIPEVGPEIAASVEQFFREQANQKVLKRMFEAGLEIEVIPEQKDNQFLEGKNFVFTGSLEKYTRSQAERIVESLGARATSSVSHNTDIVVVGKEPGSKFNEAKKMGIKIISEEEFEELIK